MTTYAKIKTTHVVLEPTPASAAPYGSLFNDSSNFNTFTNRDTGGVCTAVGATTSVNVMVKSKKNMSGSVIPAYRRVALHSDGTIVLADSDNLTAMKDIGISLDPISHNTFGRIMLNGANAPGVLAGLGFATGDSIYLSKTPGMLVNTSAGFNAETDTIMRVGTADCADADASAAATDLIMTVEVYSSPGGA